MSALRWPELGDVVEVPPSRPPPALAETDHAGARWLLADVTEAGSISDAAGTMTPAFWVTLRATAISAARGLAVPRTAANHGEMWRWPRPAAEVAGHHLAGRVPPAKGKRKVRR